MLERSIGREAWEPPLISILVSGAKLFRPCPNRLLSSVAHSPLFPSLFDFCLHFLSTLYLPDTTMLLGTNAGVNG